jgi:hypothetical protein
LPGRPLKRWLTSKSVSGWLPSTRVKAADCETGADATDAHLHSPYDVVIDGGGHLCIATSDGIRRVDCDGTITTVTNDTSIGAMAIDRHGDLYYVDGGRVKVVVQPGRLPNLFP